MDSLPADLLEKIASNLEPSALAQMTTVSTSMRPTFSDACDSSLDELEAEILAEFLVAHEAVTLAEKYIEELREPYEHAAVFQTFVRSEMVYSFDEEEYDTVQEIFEEHFRARTKLQWKFTYQEDWADYWGNPGRIIMMRAMWRGVWISLDATFEPSDTFVSPSYESENGFLASEDEEEEERARPEGAPRWRADTEEDPSPLPWQYVVFGRAVKKLQKRYDEDHAHEPKHTFTETPFDGDLQPLFDRGARVYVFGP